jgi:alpha-tubulin suppressor-like RCC1 family protein
MPDGSMPDVIVQGDSGCTAGACVTSVASGAQHTSAATNAGTVFCWGNNSAGQLGDGTTTSRPRPVMVTGLTGVRALALGDLFSCALLNNGQVWCWGGNADGELGNNGMTPSATPVQVVSLPNATAIAAGVAHACAVTGQGTIYCWGRNDAGQTGNAMMGGDVRLPSMVNITGVASVACGGSTTCILGTNQNLWCWGDNSNGQLGINSTTDQDSPTGVGGLSALPISLTVGNSFTCVGYPGAGNSEDIACWGANGYGQFGDGTTNSTTTPPTSPGLSTVALFSAGGYYSCGTDQGNGEVFCEGQNVEGELANGGSDGSSHFNPTKTSPVVAKVTQLSTSLRHACALSTNSPHVYCWGKNDDGEIGDGTTIERDTPTPVAF